MNRTKTLIVGGVLAFLILSKGRDSSVAGLGGLAGPWSDKLITTNVDAIRDAGLPMPTGVELGEGHYGAVYKTTDPNVVFKVTSDTTEALFIRQSLKLDSPTGIVQYHAIIDLSGQRRNRNTFGVWREAAVSVGLVVKTWGELTYDDRNALGFQNYLQHFKRAAALARETIEKKPNILDFAKRREAVEWAWQAVEMEMAAPTNNIWSALKRDQPLARFVGWQRVAACLRACEMIAEAMEHNNPMSTHVGSALAFYLENNLLLADLHAQNVGQVIREDYGTKPIWVITDPGHAVSLVPR